MVKLNRDLEILFHLQTFVQNACHIPFQFHRNTQHKLYTPRRVFHIALKNCLHYKSRLKYHQNESYIHVYQARERLLYNPAKLCCTQIGRPNQNSAPQPANSRIRATIHVSDPRHLPSSRSHPSVSVPSNGAAFLRTPPLAL
jgi:hypothetical protein